VPTREHESHHGDADGDRHDPDVQQMPPELLDEGTRYEHADDQTDDQRGQGESGVDR